MAVIRNWTENRAIAASGRRVTKVVALLEEIAALWSEDNYVDTICSEMRDQLREMQLGIVVAAQERAEQAEDR